MSFWVYICQQNLNTFEIQITRHEGISMKGETHNRYGQTSISNISLPKQIGSHNKILIYPNKCLCIPAFHCFFIKFFKV